MGLSIFAYDLEALINSLSNIINTIEGENPEIVQMPENSLASTTEVLAAAAETTDSLIEEILLATTVSNTALSLNSAGDVQKKGSGSPGNSSSGPVIPASGSSEEKYRKAIEQLIKSLHISVMHSYQSSDIINEKISLDNVADFPKKTHLNDRETKSDYLKEEEKRQELKLRELKEELKKSMLKNSSNRL